MKKCYIDTEIQIRRRYLQENGKLPFILLPSTWNLQNVLCIFLARVLNCYILSIDWWLFTLPLYLVRGKSIRFMFRWQLCGDKVWFMHQRALEINLDEIKRGADIDYMSLFWLYMAHKASKCLLVSAGVLKSPLMKMWERSSWVFVGA